MSEKKHTFHEDSIQPVTGPGKDSFTRNINPQTNKIRPLPSGSFNIVIQPPSPPTVPSRPASSNNSQNNS